MGTANQLQAVSSLTSVSVAGVYLPIADSMKVLGVTLDHRLTLDNHVSAVARSCNYHARASLPDIASSETSSSITHATEAA